MPSELAIQTQGLYKSFGTKEVLHNCSLSVKQGEIYGFLGVNGAGKTTMFKLLTGLLTPTMGTIQILGEDITTQRESILKRIGSLIEVPVFYEHLSARKNLEIHLSYMGMENNFSKIDETLDKVGLKGAGTQPVSEYSLGMKQRLAIARAMIHKPTLLVLDEPMNGLDPVGIHEIRELFKSLVQEFHVTILFSSHILSEVEQIAETIGIISNGRIVNQISLHDLKKDPSFNLEEYFISVTGRGC